MRLKAWFLGLVLFSATFLLVACQDIQLNPTPPNGTGSPFMVATARAVFSPIAATQAVSLTTPAFFVGIFLFPDRDSSTDYDCFDFIRFYADGLVIAEYICDVKGQLASEVWQRGMREALQREELPLGPWRGLYGLDGHTIDIELFKKRGIGVEGELWKYYSGTYVSGVLILEGKQYQPCVECETPLP